MFILFLITSSQSFLSQSSCFAHSLPAGVVLNASVLLARSAMSCCDRAGFTAAGACCEWEPNAPPITLMSTTNPKNPATIFPIHPIPIFLWQTGHTIAAFGIEDLQYLQSFFAKSVAPFSIHVSDKTDKHGGLSDTQKARHGSPTFVEHTGFPVRPIKQTP